MYRSRKRKYIHVLLLFATALLLRTLPEIAVRKYPVGYDLLAYYIPIATRLAPEIKANGIVKAVKTIQAGAHRQAPLFHVATALILLATGVNPLTLFKALSPILYALLILSYYLFLTKALEKSHRQAILTSLLLAFHPISLRISWDLLRNTTGMALFFILCIVLKNSQKTPLRKTIYATILMITIALTHQLAATLATLAVAELLLRQLRDKQSRREALKTAVILAPYIIWAAKYKYLQAILKGGLLHGELELEHRGMPLASTLLLFLLSYHITIPIIILGIRKEIFLTLPTIWLTYATFSPIIPAIPAPLVSVRWQLLLVYPLTIFFTNGLQKTPKNTRKHTVYVYTSIAIALGLLYASGIYEPLTGKPARQYIQKTLADKPERQHAVKYAGLLSIGVQPDHAELTSTLIQPIGSYIPANLVRTVLGDYKTNITSYMLALKWLDKHKPKNTQLALEPSKAHLARTAIETPSIMKLYPERQRDPQKYLLNSATSSPRSRNTYYIPQKQDPNYTLLRQAISQIYDNGDFEILHLPPRG